MSATPWVEKYRPKNLQEVSHQSEVVSTLQNAVETNRLPHLLLYGPPGTGKTSVALALCKTLWHPSQLSRRVLELNASDERGISVVRDKIKHFASLAVGNAVSSNPTAAANAKKLFFANKTEKAVGTTSSNTNTTSTNTGAPSNVSNTNGQVPDVDMEPQFPNPPFKIIILDEADTVTPDAQAALRRVIEAHSKITRFILICNYVTRIIEPLASRCAKFRYVVHVSPYIYTITTYRLIPFAMNAIVSFTHNRFQSLPPSSMMERLNFISDNEGCRFKDNDKMKILNEILEISQGDMRRAVTTLQSVHTLSGTDGVIELDNISEMAGLPPSSVVNKLMQIFMDPASNFGHLEKEVNDIMLEGYAAQQVMKALLKKILISEDAITLSEMGKAKIAIKIAEADKNLIDSADESLQLLSVCSLILQCFKERQ